MDVEQLIDEAPILLRAARLMCLWWRLVASKCAMAICLVLVHENALASGAGCERVYQGTRGTSTSDARPGSRLQLSSER